MPLIIVHIRATIQERRIQAPADCGWNFMLDFVDVISQAGYTLSYYELLYLLRRTP